VAVIVTKLATTSKAVKAFIGAMIGILAHALLDAPLVGLLAAPDSSSSQCPQ
jgi:hypothetical protein